MVIFGRGANVSHSKTATASRRLKDASRFASLSVWHDWTVGTPRAVGGPVLTASPWPGPARSVGRADHGSITAPWSAESRGRVRRRPQMTAGDVRVDDKTHAHCRDPNYTVGQKSTLLLLSEYVNKTEKIGGMWTNTNGYRENEAVSDIFTWNILRHNCFIFKYYMTESSQWNYYLLLGKNIMKHDVMKVEHKLLNTTQIKLVLPTFNSWTVHKIIEYLTLGLLSSLWNIYHSTAAYFFDPPSIQGGPQKPDCFWELINLEQLAIGKCVIWQKFPIFV